MSSDSEQQLIELGFAKEEASGALKKFGGNVEHAANWLFTASAEEKAALNRPPPQSQAGAPQFSFGGGGGFNFQAPSSSASLANHPGPYKMILVVRNDLGMSPGKMCAQCSHAAVDLVLAAQRTSPHSAWLQNWKDDACAKITLQAPDMATLKKLYDDAKAAGLPAVLIRDAGRTQVDPGTTTVLGIGPAPNALIDPITGKLQLL